MPADRLAQSIMPSVTVSPGRRTQPPLAVGEPSQRTSGPHPVHVVTSIEDPAGQGSANPPESRPAAVVVHVARGAEEPSPGSTISQLTSPEVDEKRSVLASVVPAVTNASTTPASHNIPKASPNHFRIRSASRVDGLRRRRCGDFQVAGAAGGGKAGPAARAASADATMDEGMDRGRICSTPGSDIRSGTRRRSSGNPSRTSSSTVGTSGRPSASNADTMADALHRAVRRGPPTPSRNCRRRASLPTTTWMPLRNSTRSPTSPTGLRGPTRASAISAGDDGITTTAPWTNKRSGPAAPIPFFTA